MSNIKEVIEALDQVEKMLNEERTCHNDCMCNICIAKQQTWEAQQALAKLRTEQPPAGEFTKEIGQWIKDRQLPDSEFTRRFRDLIKLSIKHLSKNKIGRLRTYGEEACYRLDRSEASRKELLTACERITTMFDCQRVKGFPKCKEGDMCCVCSAEAAIAKEKEVKK